MSKILLAVNTLTSVDTAVYSNHCQFWFRLGRSSSHEMMLYHPRRMSIDRMRNVAARVALDNNCDYLMFVDDDVLIPTNALDKLIEVDADIVSGWTIIRGYPYENMFFRYMDEGQVHLTQVKDKELPRGSFTPDGGEVIDVDAVGFSCVLIKTSLLKKVEPPFFVTGPRNTEDIYFCVKVQKNISGVTIKTHLGVKTSHCLGNEYLDPLSKKLYKEYYEKLDPGVLAPQEPQKIEMTEEPKVGELSYEDILENEIWPENLSLADMINVTE